MFESNSTTLQMGVFGSVPLDENEIAKNLHPL